MSGHVTELKDGVGKRIRQDGSYRLVIVYRDRDGRQQTETLPPGHNRKTAKLERAERVREASRGMAPGTMTLSEFLPVWERSVDGRLRPQTLHGYHGLVKNHLKPAFGRRRLRDLRPSQVQAWLDHGDGAKLSAAMQRKAIGCLSVILKAASVRDLAEAPAFNALVVKPSEHEEMRALTIPELDTLTSHLDAWYRPDVLWLAFTGLRRGEHSAFPTTALNVSERTARISQTLDRYGSIGPTKNPWSTRTLQLNQRALDAAKQKLEQRLASGIRSDLLWTTRAGTPMNWPNFHRDHWAPAAIAAGLATRDDDGKYHGVRVHDLRHTFTSLALAAGLEVAFISQQLGHKNTLVTQAIYAHWMHDRDPQMVDRFDQAYTQEQR